MTPVRIGLAGYGRGGRYFHAPLIGLAPECALAAVVTQNPRRRAELAQDLPGVPAVNSLGDLAAAGALGEVIAFESRMEQYPPAQGFATTGGGVLRDFGSHLTDQALQLFGPAARCTRRPT